MAEKHGDFWNLDLTKLTWSGWLLILLSIGVVVAVMLAMIALLAALGFPISDRSGNKRWLGLVALIPALGAGSGVFVLGRRLLDQWGAPIMRRESSD